MQSYRYTPELYSNNQFDQLQHSKKTSLFKYSEKFAQKLDCGTL